MNSATNNGQHGAGTSRFRPSSDTLYERIGDEIVLIHMRTNQIYELSRTAARFWDLLCAGYDRVEIQQLLSEEFDVAEADLEREIEALLASLKEEGLITSNEND